MPRRALAAPSTHPFSAFLVACLVTGCAWYAQVPDWSRQKRRVVVDPAERSTQLALDAPYVGELDCYAPSCRERFRVVVSEPGRLTVRATMDLTSQDDQARMVLESLNGPLGQAGTGRGPRTDVTPLALRREVEPGTYFVLLQSVGGPVRYELEATLTPDGGPRPETVADAAPWVEAPRLDPPPKLTEVDLGLNSGGGFDEAVAFDRLESFTFPRFARPGEGRQPGMRLEQPRDRQLRRLIAEVLELRGLRQSTGDEIADVVVVASTTGKVRAVANMGIVYDQYALRDMGPIEVLPQGTLTIDIMETRTGRLAWHAWTNKALSRVVPTEETRSELLREAVTDALSGFPPR